MSSFVVVGNALSPSAAHRLYRSTCRCLAATYDDVPILEVVATAATEEAVETVVTAAVGFVLVVKQ